MKKTIFNAAGLTLLQEGEQYYVTYDAGAHQVIIRTDAISATDADRIMRNHDEANLVLQALQHELITQGHDPYKPNP